MPLAAFMQRQSHSPASPILVGAPPDIGWNVPTCCRRQIHPRLRSHSMQSLVVCRSLLTPPSSAPHWSEKPAGRRGFSQSNGPNLYAGSSLPALRVSSLAYRRREAGEGNGGGKGRTDSKRPCLHAAASGRTLYNTCLAACAASNGPHWLLAIERRQVNPLKSLHQTRLVLSDQAHDAGKFCYRDF